MRTDFGKAKMQLLNKRLINYLKFIPIALAMLLTTIQRIIHGESLINFSIKSKLGKSPFNV